MDERDSSDTGNENPLIEVEFDDDVAHFQDLIDAGADTASL